MIVFNECPECQGEGQVESDRMPPPAEQLHAILLTPAQQFQTLYALELRMSDLTERDQVLAIGDVCNLLRAALGMEAVNYWDDSD